VDMPFPGIDPYLEHPVLWEGIHARLIVAFANQLQPQLDPRYVASVEERVFIEGPQRRIPDVWIQKTRDDGGAAAMAAPDADTAVVLEVETLEIHETRIEILDVYNGMRLVTMIEVVSPTNKVSGPGRDSYRAKQKEALARDCHLVEIDLLRRGRHVLSIPKWRTAEVRPYDYLACVSRSQQRNRFELYARRLRDRLPRIKVPLAEPDPWWPWTCRLRCSRSIAMGDTRGAFAMTSRASRACHRPTSNGPASVGRHFESRTRSSPRHR
jgi:Protein of unknown function (DUF4058)